MKRILVKTLAESMIKSLKRYKIFKIYFASLFFYCIPLIFLIEFIIIDQFTSHKAVTDWFLVKVDFIIFPSAIVGFSFAVIGLIFSFILKEKMNKIIGLVCLVIGLITIYIGLKLSIGHILDAFDDFSF